MSFLLADRVLHALYPIVLMSRSSAYSSDWCSVKKEGQHVGLSYSVTVLGVYICILCFLAMNLMLVASLRYIR